MTSIAAGGSGHGADKSTDSGAGSQPRRSGDLAPSVLVEPGAHTGAGGVARMRVHARNLAPDVRTLTVRVVGLERSWLPAPVAAPAVPADATVTVELELTPPSGAVPGDYACLIVVEALTDAQPEQGPDRTVLDAAFRVDGASELVLALEPAEVRGVRRRQVEVVLGNTGATATDVELDAGGDEALVVGLRAASVHLRPAETVRVPMTVGTRRPKVAGERARHTFAVTAVGAGAPQRTLGTFTARPLLSGAVMRVTAVVAVLALWITAVALVLPLLTQDGEGPPSAQETEQSAGAGGPGGDADGSGGADDAAGPAAQTQPVRASGLVSGAAPGGVRVEVVPTSSLTADTLTLGTTQRSAGVGAPGKLAAAAMPFERGSVAQRMSTSTNDNGVWAISGLSATARYLVVISKPGFGTQRLVMTGAQLAAVPLETDLRAGEGSMSGRVTGPDGPVGGVELTLSDGTSTVTTRTATDGDVGRWRVDGLTTPSTYLVSAAASGLGSEARLITLPASGSATVDLALEAGIAAIGGQVIGIDSLGAHGGLGGITVTATDGVTTRTATTVTGADSGRFLLPGLPAPATYTVTISGTGYATVTRQLQLDVEGISGWDISLTPAGGAVTGTVTDDAGEGIAAAGLVLTGGASGGAEYKTMSASDGSGTFRFSGVAPGTYVLSAESFGHRTGFAEVVVTAGGTVDVPIVLEPIPGDGLVATSSIVGRVADASTSGQITCPVLPPGETCLITATTTAVSADGTHRTIVVETTPDEPYRLPAVGEEGLLPGRYVVTITAPGYEPGRVTVTVPMGTEAEAATVALVPSPSLIGTVQARVGVLAGDICVIARAVTGTDADSAQPTCAQACETSGTNARCAPLESGMYRLDRLPAGSYVITVSGLPPGYVTPEPQILALLPGELRRYDVMVERLGILSVTALVSDGAGSVAPATDSWVRVERADESVVTEAQVDPGGFVQLTGIPPGTYSVIGSTTQTGEAIATTAVSIGLNQEINLQLVLAAPVQEVLARAVYQRSAAATIGIPDAEITVTGIVGYNGAAPQRDQRTFTTDSGGQARICTTRTPECLPLVENTVDVRIDAPGFEPYAANSVTMESLVNIVMVPSARPFSGGVLLLPNPEQPAQRAELYQQVRFEVLQAPPGVQDLSLRADSTGEVVLTDPAQAQPNRIRPGEYLIVAHLSGYSSQTVPISVDLHTSGADPGPPRQEWSLRKNARVGIKAVEIAPDGSQIDLTGAVMTLRGPDELEIERVATADQVTLDFGTLPADDYSIDVAVAGYAFVVEQTITIAPGATIAAPTPVVLERRGAISGTVVSELTSTYTQALPGATISAQPTVEPQPSPFTTTSGAGGSFRVTGSTEREGLPGGPFSVTVSAPQHNVVTVTRDLGVGEQASIAEVRLVPDRASLLVTVRDGTTAVEGMQLQLVHRDNQITEVPPGVCEPGTTGCATSGGTYHLPGLLPATYTLFVSGQGYLPLTTTVTLAAGENATLDIPITTPAGSIQGTVFRTQADGSTVALADPDPELIQVVLAGGTGADPVAASLDGAGSYLFRDLAPGTYSVTVQQRAGPGDAWVSGPTRSLTVLSAQSVVADLVLPRVSRMVTVTATANDGIDLTGGLVTLTGTSDGQTITLGPQPLSRAGTAFTSSFAQVPPGNWRASVTGPAGHHGTYQGTPFEVTPTSPATVPAAVTVAATELRLRVAAPPPDPRPAPGQVTVTAAPSGDGTPTGVGDIQTAVIPGASDTVLFVPAIGWNLTVAPPGDGWQAAVAPTSVSASVPRLLATVTLTPQPISTTTSVTLGLAAFAAGEVTEVTATVEVSTTGDPAPTGGLVTLEYRRVDDSWIALVPAELNSGSPTFSLTTSDWTAGTYEVRAGYGGAPPWSASGSATSTIVVTAPPTGGGGGGDGG